MIEQCNDDVVRVLILVDLDWYDGPVRLHTGVGDIVFRGTTYQGIGNLAGIGDVKEDGEMNTGSVVLTMSGLDPLVIHQALSDESIGRDGTVWIAFTDEAGQIVDYEELFPGRIASVPIVIGDQNTVSLRLTSRMDVWDKPGNERYTNQSHQQRHPGDEFLCYVAPMAEKSIYWGNEKDGIPLRNL